MIEAGEIDPEEFEGKEEYEEGSMKKEMKVMKDNMIFLRIENQRLK